MHFKKKRKVRTMQKQERTIPMTSVSLIGPSLSILMYNISGHPSPLFKTKLGGRNWTTWAEMANPIIIDTKEILKQGFA